MDDGAALQQILGASQKAEKLLRQLGGTGRGMVELSKSLEVKIGPDLCKAIQTAGRFRNKVVHEGHSSAQGFARFDKAMGRVIPELTRLAAEPELTRANQGQKDARRDPSGQPRTSEPSTVKSALKIVGIAALAAGVLAQIFLS